MVSLKWLWTASGGGSRQVHGMAPCVAARVVLARVARVADQPCPIGEVGCVGAARKALGGSVCNDLRKSVAFCFMHTCNTSQTPHAPRASQRHPQPHPFPSALTTTATTILSGSSLEEASIRKFHRLLSCVNVPNSLV